MANSSQLKFQSFVVVGEKAEDQISLLASQLGISLIKTSPDITIITPEKKSISIEQIREIKKSIDQKPVSGKRKLIVIEKAETLTMQAQNSLLKLFEEPPKHAVIILGTKSKADLLPTIISRAVVIYTQLAKKNEKREPILLSNKKTSELMDEIANIDDPIKWLDSEIDALHKSLIENVNVKKSSFSIRSAIEKCAESKKMIDANVNAKFVLANLVFSIKTA